GSDVCSSDLVVAGDDEGRAGAIGLGAELGEVVDLPGFDDDHVGRGADRVVELVFGEGPGVDEDGATRICDRLEGPAELILPHAGQDSHCSRLRASWLCSTFLPSSSSRIGLTM